MLDVLRQARQRQTLGGTLAVGRKGEDLAHRYLEKQGYRIIARNYRRSGLAGGADVELDLVARHEGQLIFIEVKSRRSADHGAPDRAIDRDKRRNIVRAARAYAKSAREEWDAVRFDTVSVVLSDPPLIFHVCDAFFPGRVR